MKNKLIIAAFSASLIIIAGCEFDNYNPPKSILSGNVTYNNVPVGVRSGATQLELWQYSWNTRGVIARSKVPVYIDQDGSFSARLYDGDYKLVRLKGGPWAAQTDSISVTVKGNTTVDVPVTPFFTITNPAFTLAGSDITGTCNLTKVGTYDITSVTLYIGVTNILDANNNSQKQDLTTGLTDLSTPKQVKVTLSSTNLARDYVFVRLGVLSKGSSERYYSPVQEITLP